MLHFGKIPKKFGQIWRKFSKILAKIAKFWKKTAKNSAVFNENFEIRERCKGVHCVDLGESFPTSIYLQKSASIQPRTSLVKFARSPRTEPPEPKAAAALVARFDIEPYSDFSSKWSNFTRLVLGCINADFYNQALKSTSNKFAWILTQRLPEFW